MKHENPNVPSCDNFESCDYYTLISQKENLFVMCILKKTPLRVLTVLGANSSEA